MLDFYYLQNRHEPVDYLYTRVIVLGGLFDNGGDIQRTFETSAKAVNKERHENMEFANVFLVADSNEVNTDPYEVSVKGTG